MSFQNTPDTLIHIFGPDGAGKSTLARQIAGNFAGSVLFNASDPRSWPDLSWHNEIVQRGLDPKTTDPAYHLQTLDRCYGLAGRLLAEGVSPVVIDSDPRAQISVKAVALHGYPASIEDFYNELDGAARTHTSPDTRQIGLHVTVQGEAPLAHRAATLLDRISERDQTSELDPASLEETQALVVAFDALEEVLRSRGASCLRVETHEPVDTSSIMQRLVPPQLPAGTL